MIKAMKAIDRCWLSCEIKAWPPVTRTGLSLVQHSSYTSTSVVALAHVVDFVDADGCLTRKVLLHKEGASSQGSDIRSVLAGKF